MNAFQLTSQRYDNKSNVSDPVVSTVRNISHVSRWFSVESNEVGQASFKSISSIWCLDWNGVLTSVLFSLLVITVAVDPFDIFNHKLDVFDSAGLSFFAYLLGTFDMVCKLWQLLFKCSAAPTLLIFALHFSSSATLIKSFNTPSSEDKTLLPSYFVPETRYNARIKDNVCLFSSWIEIYPWPVRRDYTDLIV